MIIYVFSGFFILCSISLDRIMSLEKELLQSQTKFGQLQTKYAKKNSMLKKVKCQLAALKSEERKRKQNEKNAGLKVRSQR